VLPSSIYRKIYTAKKKDTGEPVSIWVLLVPPPLLAVWTAYAEFGVMPAWGGWQVFEKKQLEKHSRDVQEAVLAMLRADVRGHPLAACCITTAACHNVEAGCFLSGR